MATANGTADESLCTRCLNWKSHDQFYKKTRSKTGRCAACKLCMDIARACWIAANPEKAKQVERDCRAKHREVMNARTAQWEKLNRDRKNTVRKAWREENRERDTAYTRKWQAKNPESLTANNSRRRASKMRAQPAWANEFFIAEAYHLARVRAKVCGGKWHVDHIVPLKSKLVCGLHVEHNLQVIPASVNQRKSNIHWPDMP